MIGPVAVHLRSPNRSRGFGGIKIAQRVSAGEAGKRSKSVGTVLMRLRAGARELHLPPTQFLSVFPVFSVY
jgi:hypothetical protein